jgi:acyl-CoA thioester hydrolase
MGHMNIMWYVAKFDEANWNLIAALGMTPSYLRRESRGMAAVQQNITYKREALAGDILEVKSRVLEFSERSMRLVHEMSNGETTELVAHCELTAVHLDRLQRRAIPFPSIIRESIAAAVTGAAAAPFVSLESK